MTLRGLVRYHVLFVMELSTRVVEIAGIVANISDYLLFKTVIDTK